MYSLIIPVYKNAGSIPELLKMLHKLDVDLQNQLQVVFVIDGSPDQSYALLRDGLAECALNAKLISHSRNFGSFAAIRTGLAAADGNYFAVMAADLQEPPELPLQFFHILKKNLADVVIGTRERRADPFFSRCMSTIFWRLYRYFVIPEMPAGGVDVFGCNRAFRDQLLKLEESHTSLISLLFWLGFRRTAISYQRHSRQHGKSAWTFRKKINYLMDSAFSFTDFPIKALLITGIFGIVFSIIVASFTLMAKISGLLADVPGYAAIILAINFFGGLNLLGLGLVGSYAWRAYENSKFRPLAIVTNEIVFSRSITLNKSTEETS